MIDSNLTWKPHIEYICKKISKACGSLAKIRHCVNIDTMISVYYALAHSYLRYGISTWGCASDNALQLLISIINRAVRIMTFAPFDNIDVQSIFKYLYVPNVVQTLKIETSKFFYKKQNNLLPSPNIANFFNTRNADVVHGYNLRNRKDKIQTISFGTSHGKKSIQHRGAVLWNEMPSDVTDSNTLSIFKRKYKDYLLEDDVTDDDDVYVYF